MCKTHCLSSGGFAGVSGHKPPVSAILSSWPALSNLLNSSKPPSNSHSSTSKPLSTSKARSPPSHNAQYFTQVASNDSSNVEAACAVQGAERVEVESIAKLASTKVAIYRYVSVARPTPFILQGRVIANRLQMTGEILAKVRITSTLLQHYQYRMQCWVLTKVDSVLLLEDGLKLDGAPVIFLKALTELTDLEEFDDILALAKQSSDLLMQPASLGNC